MTTASIQPVRVGFLIPSVNVVLETDIRSLVPSGVSAHIARVQWRPRQSPEELRDVRRTAAEQIADVRPAVVGFACSAETMVSAEETRTIVAQFADLIPAPVISSGQALVDRLHADGARRIAVLTPVDRCAAGHEFAFLASSGFDLVDTDALDIADPAEISDLPGDAIADLVTRWEGQSIDAGVILCATFRGVEAVERVRGHLGVPVLAINAVLVDAVLAASADVAQPIDL